MSDPHYDLLVIGSGPGGQKAAIAAAKLGKRAAVVERRHMVGGVCINTGTIPSKTLREAVLYLTGMNMREIYGQNYRVKDEITVQDLLARTTHVIGREIEIIRSQLFRNGVRPGQRAPAASSTRTPSPYARTDSDQEQLITADYIVVAVGTHAGTATSGGVRRPADHRLRRHPAHGAGARARWSSSAPA